MLRFARPSRVVRSIAARRTFAATPRASLPPRPSAKDDPWAMPLAPENVNPERDPPGTAPREQDIDLSDPNLPFPEPLSREGESMEQLRARLVYQTRKRGTLESDLIMSTFAKQHMADMSEVELKEFDRLLDENDWDTFYWATGKRQPPERWENSELLQKLAKHARNEEKVARRMPTL